MDFQRLKTKITYKIEPNPAGGLIARSADPSIPAIEAPTMEVLQTKLQAQLMETIAGQFPMLKIPMAIAKTAAAFGGSASQTLTVTDSKGESAVTRQPSSGEVTQFAEQFAGIMQKNFPELAQELSAKAEAMAPSKPMAPTSQPLSSFKNESSASFATDAANRPIVPETSGGWKFVVMLAVAIALALAFVLYVRR